MPVIAQKTDYATQALSRLLGQFQNKTVITAIHAAISSEVQALEDMFISLQTLLDIATQVGVQLDGIGTIVGEARDGKTDASYRTALTARIAELYASGAGEDVITAFISATSSANVDFLPDFPAGYGIYGDAASYPADILTIMEAASVAGVYVAIFERLTKEGSADLITTEAGDAIYLRSESSGR